MKKSIYFLFLLVFVLGITACNKITTTTETNIPATTTTTVTTETTTESTTSATTTETTVSLVSTTTIVDTSATTTTSSTVVSTTEAITLSFASIALASGSSDGELLLNISRAGEHGVIYFIIVAEGSQVPTAEQIVSGDDYGDVTVAAAGSADSYSNHVVASLTPGARYTLYTVIAHEQLRSIVRNMTQTAKLNVIAVDKGEGTEEDPFQISTVADLEQVGAGYYAADEKEWNMDSCYVLMNDIDLTDKYGPDLSDWPVLGSDSAGNRFSGVFDGAGFTILGLYVGPTSTAGAYRGLFAASEHAAVVKNLVLQDAVVTGAGIDESNSSHGTGVLFGYFKGSVENIRILNASVFDTGTRVGGLAGRSYESGHVRNVYVTGNVRGQNRVGGIAGVVDVSDSTATPIIYQNVVFDGEVIGETQHIGGLVGYLRGVQMSNVYVTGYIQGGQEVGGVAGFYQKRSGNNLIASSIDGAIVYATVYGTSSTPTIGYIVGQKSTTGITVENEHLLQVLNCFHVEGSQVINGGDPKAVLGTLVSQTDIGSSAWFVLNLPSFDFDDVWEFKLGAARPTLQATSDLGLLGELSLPLVLLPSFTSGPEEKQITVRISANKEDTTIYYAILDSQDTIPTVLELKDPTGLSGVLESGSDALVQATFTMPEFDTPYYVFYYAEHADGNSEVLQGTVTSKPMTELMIEGGLRPGDTDKEIILTLSSNLDGTINYIIVAQEGVYAKADILAPIDVLESGSGTTINIAFVMPNPETTYYVYAVAVLPDRESVVFSSSGLSSSENYVNYGTGSVADPFVIRTVTDLENIGNASYINDAEVALEYLSSANYILENDIDLTGEYGEGLLSWTPLPEFYGVLDGNGHSLLGLYINAPESVTHNGLFSYMRAGSVVKNLTLDGVYVNVLGQQSDGTNGMTGAIAGRMNSASMDNIRILNAEIISHGFRVGALAGGNEGTNGHLTNIYVEADVTGFARVGGIIGNITNSSTEAFNLKDFVFKGTVTMIGTSDFRVGGVVGWARGVAIQNGYVEGAIGGVGAIAGGVAGYMESYSDTATFAKIENVLVNVVVISSVGRSGGLIGNVSSTAYKVPTLTNAYQTLQTTMVIDGSQSTSVRHGTSVDETLFTAVWFETNMPGLASIDFWTFLSEADRPALNNSPDTGLIGLLEVPLVISDQIQTGSSEKEILVKLATNRLTDVIHYVVTLGGTFNATEIIDAVQGGTFLFVGEGQSIDQVHLMAEYGTIYTVHYVVVSGVEVSEVFVKSVTSGAEVALVIEATAVTGEVDPGDIEVDLQSTSHPASVWVLALPALDPAPSAETIKSTGTLLVDTLVLALTPGASYKVYLTGEKSEGTLNGEVLVLEAVAKAELEAPFTLSVATLEANENPGELVLTLQTSHDSSIYYLVLLTTDPVPTSSEIETTGEVLVSSPVTLTLTPDTEYIVYVLAKRTDSTDTASINLQEVTKRELFNGEQTSSYYPIYELEDLESFRDGVNSGAISNSATLEFMADIDMSSEYGEEGKNWVPIGDYENTTVKFKGNVVGNDHVINGLYINRVTSSVDKGTGFFGTTDSAFQIANLHFTNVDVTGTYSVGAVIGYAKVAHLQNVSVSGGTVTSTQTSDSRVGGLIGRLNSSSSTDTFVEFAWTDVSVVGYKHVGGLIGHADYSSDTAAGELFIRDVYTLGTVSSTLSSSANVGGVIGYLRVTLIRAIAYGAVTNASTQCGGVVGYLQIRSATNVVSKAIDIIAANDHTKVIGQASTSNGEPTVTNNLLVVAADPQAGQITLEQLLNPSNWGTLIPLSDTTWEVVNNKVVLK